MQFGNIFVDIEVKGENITKYITKDTGISCIIVETAGASLPYAYVKFITFEERIMNLIQLGNKVKLTVGNNEANKDTFELDIIPAQPNKDGSDTGWTVEFAGFIGSKAFMINHKNKVYKGNSIEVAQQIIKETMSNVTIVNDFTSVKEEPVNWMEMNNTDNLFLAEVLIHSNVQPSFPLFSFDKYLNFYIKDVYKSVKEGPKYRFIAGKPKTTKDITYQNNFNPQSYKHAYNLYSGYGKLSEIQDIKSGQIKAFVDDQVTIISASQMAEQDTEHMNIIQTNDIQSGNVHKTYNESFLWNTNRLVALSSIQGIVELNGKYYKELKPLELVYVEPNDPADSAYTGNYLIDTIVTTFSYNMASANTGGARTYVYVVKDNKNNVENYSLSQIITSPLVKGFNIFKKRRDSLISFCYSIKYARSLALKFIDGEYLRRLLQFAIDAKIGVLQAFGINKIIQDWTSKLNALNSLILGGNSLMNSLLNMLLPQDLFTVLKDFLINENTSAEKIIRDYLYTYTPTDVLDVALLLVDSLSGATKELINIAHDNGLKLNSAGGFDMVSTNIETLPSQDKVGNIITSFENNTIGLNIPFPIITLTESENLLPEKELEDFVADRVIENLDSLNYLEDVNKDDLKDMLLGNKEVSFDVINQINKNVGEILYYRFWGTFNDIIDLTSFKIKKSYKDKYKTIPCTKIVSALDNTRVFFCCPKQEEIKFYVNSKLVNLDSFEIDLGYVDAYKLPIIYNVYYTDDRFNSSSVLLEIRQKVVV